MSVLVTGAAGFIGFHVARHLLEKTMSVIGFDNVNDYYDIELKEARLDVLRTYSKFKFVRSELHNKDSVNQVFKTYHPDIVINLAAQAGVRFSLTNPYAYVESNIVGFLNILEACRHNKVKHLIFASSSSVYGGNTQVPFSETDDTEHPVSFYGVSKKSNELMAHSYAYQYGLPVTGLRFFTVYGPWGRPDMAYFKFVRSILAEKVIRVFNYGNHVRDLTYIDDIVEVILRIIDLPPANAMVPYYIYNVGNSAPVTLVNMIEILEEELGKTAKKELFSMQTGDMVATWADTNSLRERINFSPSTPVNLGLREFVHWYLDFYK
ncbi:MAG: NAD-dependent epimerase/dehydratase family protein [Hyphomicrobiaceae bacterium]|nr:NAD-dependent epimerase/dehydratase family protein [Hyphomicrobiaceae bacterium]